MPPPGHSEAETQRRVGDQTQKGGGQGRGVALRHQEPGFPLDHRVGNAADGGGDHGDSRRQGLQYGQRQAFLARGKKQDIGFRQQQADGIGILPARHGNPVFKPEAAYFFPAFPDGAIAGQNRVPRRFPQGGGGEGGENFRRALAGAEFAQGQQPYRGAGLGVAPGTIFSALGQFQRHFRLNVAQADTQRLVDSLHRLGALIAKNS